MPNRERSAVDRRGEAFLRAVRHLAPVLLCLLPTAAVGQRLDADGSVGFGSTGWRIAASSQWHLRVGPRISLGTGLRFTYYGGEAAPFRNRGVVTSTLPATVSIAPAVWGVNVIVSGAVRLVGPLSGGANIDLAGVAGGASRRDRALVLRPAPGSVLLYGTNDRGSLNSEFFVGLAIGPRLGLRAGMSHYVVGYQASDAGVRSRYLRFDTVPFVALRWRP